MWEILFNGRRKDNGEWIEGFLFQTIEHTYIAYAEQFDDDLFLSPKNIFIEVIPETVGRFTGLTDKNGKKIFEGNIVDVFHDANYAGVAAERIGKFEVVFDKGCFMKRKIDGFGLFHFIASDVHTVVGNIHDNPELLKGGE